MKERESDYTYIERTCMIAKPHCSLSSLSIHIQDYSTPLYKASFMGDTDEVKDLLMGGASVHLLNSVSIHIVLFSYQYTFRQQDVHAHVLSMICTGLEERYCTDWSLSVWSCSYS